jgi:hypothetical protein
VENEMSIKFVTWGMKIWLLGMKHHVRMKKLCKVRKQIQKYEKKFNGMKQFVQGMNFLIKVRKEFARYEKKFESMKKIPMVGMKYFTKV